MERTLGWTVTTSGCVLTRCKVRTGESYFPTTGNGTRRGLEKHGLLDGASGGVLGCWGATGVRLLQCSRLGD